MCVEQSLDKLQQVWEITKEWDENWNRWKLGRLASLQTESMEDAAQDLLKKLQTLQKELKVSLVEKKKTKSSRDQLSGEDSVSAGRGVGDRR